MKKRTLILAITSLALFVACKKKDGGGGIADPGTGLTGQVCQIGVAAPEGYLCLNGILYPNNGVTGQACNYQQVVPQGYTCMNGQLIPIINSYVGSGNLLNNVQMQNSYFQGVLFLSGGSSGYAVDFNDPRVIHFYAGQVTISGTVQVLNQSLCGAPVGSYSVQGTGQIMYGSISNATLTLSGPSGMQIMISSAQLYNNSGSGLTRDSNANRLGITMASLAVNGNQCGSITTY